MTDIDGRMNAWHGATIQPEMASRFLRGYHIVNDKAIDAVKDSISPNGEIKESANETDPKEFMPAMADAVEEDAMDEFEAQGKKHMLETKKERNQAVQPVVHADDKVRGAETVGRESKRLPQVAAWDANIDTSAYLEDLLSKGMITPELYARARQAYMDGRTS